MTSKRSGRLVEKEELKRLQEGLQEEMAKNRRLKEEKLVQTYLNDLESKLAHFLNEFDIPKSWKPDSRLKYNPYKSLKQNLYRPPLIRPGLGPDETVPTCACLKEAGCDSDCQNRQLFMYT